MKQAYDTPAPRAGLAKAGVAYVGVSPDAPMPMEALQR